MIDTAETRTPRKGERAMTKIAPSILSADFACLGQEIRSIATAALNVTITSQEVEDVLNVGKMIIKAVERD